MPATSPGAILRPFGAGAATLSFCARGQSLSSVGSCRVSVFSVCLSAPGLEVGAGSCLLLSPLLLGTG